jgi:ubiquinol oxidase
MQEAENERMHLMTFIEFARPTGPRRPIIYGGFLPPAPAPRRTAHRLVGDFDEEAVLSYTQSIKVIAGRSPKVAAAPIARRYWKLTGDATLRDVVLVVRVDEAHHRHVNHGLANQLSGEPANPAPAAPYPPHADSAL